MRLRVAPVRGYGLALYLALSSAAVVCGAGCRGVREADDVSVSWNAPARPSVGDATIADFTLRDAAHQPVRGAHVELQAFMSHPGMAPVVATAVDRGDGVYRARLRFTMAGAWTIVIRGTLPDGRALNRRIDVPDVRAAG